MVGFRIGIRKVKSRKLREAAVLIYATLTAILLLMQPSRVVGQTVRAEAKVDSNHVTIGDWLRLTLEVEHPSNVTVEMPSLPDSMNGFEVVKRDSLVVRTSGEQIQRIASFTITSFDSGMHIVPPILVQYAVPGDTTKHVAETLPISIVVHGIAVDTSGEIRDVKPPLSVPITFADILPYLVAVVLIAGVGWLLRYIWKKRQRGESLLPEAPPRPANEVALEALRVLESEKLWQRGKVKEYHSQVTDIIRTYIERRFGVMAMEMVSDEVLESEAIRSLASDIRQKLKEMLVLADLVKFAKFQSVADENERSLAHAFDFVEATWRAAEVEAKPEEPVMQEVTAL